MRYKSFLELRQLAPGTINLRLGAIRRLAYEAADCGLLSADLAAGIRRVKGVRNLGVRLGNWLTAEQGNALLQVPNPDKLIGKRDRAMLCLLLACGLRRHEVVGLKVDDLERREEHWAIVDMVGKAGHVRTVPIPDWVWKEVNNWLTAAGIERGKIFRRLSKMGKTSSESLTAKAVWHIVKDSARRIGVAKLAPHDLRRYAEFRTMPNRNLRPPEYRVILDRKGEHIQHYRGPSNWEKLIVGSASKARDSPEAWKSMIVGMPSSAAGFVFDVGIMPHGEGPQKGDSAQLYRVIRHNPAFGIATIGLNRCAVLR